MGVQAWTAHAVIAEALSGSFIEGVTPIRADSVRVFHRHAADVRAASIVALQGGGEVVPHPDRPELTGRYVRWDVSRRCRQPHILEQHGGGHWSHAYKPGNAPEWEPGRVLAMKVACRKCDVCLAHRRDRWGAAAASEWRTSSRTWFGTLTIEPQDRFLRLSAVRARFTAEGRNFDSLPIEERFRELARELGPDVTKYLKRLRRGVFLPVTNKDTGAVKVVAAQLRFRFLLTTEPHADGFPHFHLLIHEISGLMPLRKRYLQDHWPYGFTQWKLVYSEAGAHYAAKYLGKFSVARVRASKNYGFHRKMEVKTTTF